MESFAGTHDPIGGQIWGWYDNLGNTLRGKNQTQRIAAEATTIIALPFAAPFALSDLMSSDFTEILFKLGAN